MSLPNIGEVEATEIVVDGTSSAVMTPTGLESPHNALKCWPRGHLPPFVMPLDPCIDCSSGSQVGTTVVQEVSYIVELSLIRTV